MPDIAELVRHHIISYDDPASYIETLDAMFDDWATYPDVCYSTEHRATVVQHYRNLTRFLRAIEELGVVRRSE